tara:strand:+ start:352 stop:945 length:594 start_codon:yes stop_codon:yes gene_type:complete
MKPLDLLSKVINSTYELQEKENMWTNSRFEKVNKLKNDYSGKAGELFLKDLCESIKIKYHYDEDVNSLDGTYDIIINGKKTEVKTAREGTSKKGEGYGIHQHENLRSGDECDYYAFVDISPTGAHLTLLKKQEVCWNAKHPQLGNTPHLRRETTDVYKWDFSQAVLKRARKADYCLKMDDKTSFREIKSFFQRRNVI